MFQAETTAKAKAGRCGNAYCVKLISACCVKGKLISGP